MIARALGFVLASSWLFVTLSTVNAERIEFFTAVEAGQLEAQFLPQNAKRAQIRLRNLTDQPLDVELPRNWAAVPSSLLAQFNPFPPLAQQPQQAGQRSQPVAAPNQNGFPNQGNPNNPLIFFMNIPAERLVEFSVDTVCLEQGAADPRPGQHYTIVPLSLVVSDVDTVSTLFDHWRTGKERQAVVQAATWHLANRNGPLDWKALTALRGPRTTTGPRPFFSRADLDAAKRLVERVQTKTSAVVTTSPIEAPASPGVSAQKR